jgi:YegS/Rv2252/BmrU family lipid kinase
MVSNPKSKVFIVINPEAGGGAARKLWPQIDRQLRKILGSFDFEETTATGHGRLLAHDAAKAGYLLVVACGGDGTIHEVVNGLNDARPSAREAIPQRLGIISMGTGGDLIRTLGYPRNWRDQILLLRDQKTRQIDLGTIDFVAGHLDGRQRETRVFINEVDIGLGVDVVQRIRKTVRVFGKKLAYLTATAQSFLLWKPIPVVIRKEDEEEERCVPVSLVVANGRYYGSGIPVAPRADPFDGLLDLVVMRKMNPIATAMASPLLYAGKHLRLPNVSYDRVTEVSLKSDGGEVKVDIDGEPVGFLPVTIGIRPKALEVICP